MGNLRVIHLWHKKQDSQIVDDRSQIDSWLRNFMYLVIMRSQYSMTIRNDSSQNQQFKTTIDTIDFFISKFTVVEEYWVSKQEVVQLRAD